MGCLGCLGFLPELIFEAILEGYFTLMQWIIPQKWIGKHFRTALKIIVGIFTVLLFAVMLLGVFALISADDDIKRFGRYMVFIPLAISTVQILFGIILRTISKRKK